MASLRNFKKDVDYLISDIIDDCYVFIHIHKDKKLEESIHIISKALELRNNIFERINKPKYKNDKKRLKTYYQDIVKDLFTEIENLSKEISSLMD